MIIHIYCGTNSANDIYVCVCVRACVRACVCVSICIVFGGMLNEEFHVKLHTVKTEVYMGH